MKKGWQVIGLSQQSRSILDCAIAIMEQEIGCKLGDYAVDDDSEHIKIQSKLANMFIEGGFGRRVIEGSIGEFQQLIGMDMHIQRYPYLRIARPGRGQDNIGIHRDTLYGCTPYEVSVVMPLTSMPACGSLHVIDGSNVEPESHYPFEAIPTDVVKKSDKHMLGFVYLKKKLPDNLPSHPVVVSVGEALAFPLSLVHGQEINRHTKPRFSVDIRLVNSHVQFEKTKTVHADYWEQLCESPVTKQARAYYAANP